MLALALSLALPPVPAGPPGVVPIVIEPSERARVRGVVRAEGEATLDLAAITIELACSSCGRPVARVRPDLAGGFEFWGLEPGAHRLTLTIEGRTIVRELSLAAGEEHALTLIVGPEPPPPERAAAIQPAPAPAPAPTPARLDPGQPLRRGGLAATVVGTSLGIGAILIASLAPCGKDGTRGANCEVDVRNTAALATGLAAAGVLTAGIVAMALGRSMQRERVSGSFALQPGGGSLVVMGRF